MLKIKSAELRKYRLPLISPLRLGEHELSIRQGIIFCIELDSGWKGYGEAAPLPSVHSETLSEVEHELCSLVKILPEKSLPEPKLEKCWGWLDNCASLSNTTTWAFEQAFFPLIGPRLLPTRTGNFRMNIAGLIHLRDSPIHWQKSIHPDIHTYKVKVGRSNPLKEGKKINLLLQMLPPISQLRLDGNRLLTPNDLRNLIRYIPLKKIAYIEEPFATLQEYNDFPDIEFAFDEYLWDKLPTCSSLGAAKTYILKPSRLGGLYQTIQWIQIALAQKKKIVLSSCYESGISMLTYYQICHHYQMTEAMGLGTYDFLKKDVFSEKILDLSQPKIPQIKFSS